MKFKLGDTVRVISRSSRYFDEVGQVMGISDLRPVLPFYVTGLEPWPLWFGPEELILADPHHEMLNDPEGQHLVQAIHDRKEKP